LAHVKLINPQDEKGRRIHRMLLEVAEELNVNTIDEIIYSWLMNHPVSIIPIIGTGKIERIKQAVEALNVDMSLEQWYRIYNASTGTELP
jgi:predicted oxidoreductase